MANVPEDLSALSDDGLLALDDVLAREQLAIRDAHRPVRAERERRQVAAEAAARVQSLTASERAALVQALTIAGIEAPEA